MAMKKMNPTQQKQTCTNKVKDIITQNKLLKTKTGFGWLV